MSRKTLRVFEHQTLRVGEPVAGPGGERLELTQRELDVLARFNDAHQGQYFHLGYRRISFRSFVGFVQVGELGIEILPKADRGAAKADEALRWRGALLEMLRVATGLRLHSPTDSSQTLARSRLLDLIVMRFLDEVERLLHEGLAKGYRTEEANGPRFRGRLLVAENLRENLVRADRFYVRFTEYDRDTLPNRILGAALEVLDELPLGASLAARVVRARALFPPLTPLRVTSELFERLRPARSTARYHGALLFARMILEQQVPELRAGATPVFALLFDMNVLWERYIAVLFRRACPAGLEVSTQESRRFWKTPEVPAKTVRPDVVVRRPGRPGAVLVADTKWKVLDGPTPADSDLQQMFVYNELFASPRAVLLYPRSPDGAVGRPGRYADRAHMCEARELGLFDKKGNSTPQVVAEIGELLEASLRDSRFANTVNVC
jgi:5-methylcytosine-specific restriction enzyme subunit McrC